MNNTLASILLAKPLQGASLFHRIRSAEVYYIGQFE